MRGACLAELAVRAALLLVLAAAAASRLVKLNAVRTLRYATHDELYQCISDLECSEGSFCHAPSRRHAPYRGHAYTRCQSCRRRKRRCQRDAMCCPGNRCSNNMCVPDLDSFLSQRLSEEDERGASKKKGGRAASRQSTKKGQVGGACLRSSDCAGGLCCARHFWSRICKPVLLEGQVCTRGGGGGPHFQRSRKWGGPQRGLELFQRCDCARGLGCRALSPETTPPERQDARGGHAPSIPSGPPRPPAPSGSGRLFAHMSLKLAAKASAPAVIVSRYAEPHSSALRGAEPHSSALRGAEPHSSMLRGAEPHSSALRGAEPHSSVLRGAEPHSSVLRGAEPHSSVLRGAESAESSKARLHLCQRN